MGTSREHLTWLAGSTIVRVQFHAPHEWLFVPSVGGSLKAFASWRVVEGKVVLTSSTELLALLKSEAPVGSATFDVPVLASRTIEGAEVSDSPRDLVLALSGGGRLEILSLYSEGESWGATSPEGFHLLGYAKGEIATWNG
jgi:hypothetical protein